MLLLVLYLIIKGENMKLNNKGYMLAEIIVCSIVTFAIAFFLIDIAINFKKKAEISYLNSK